MKPGWIIMPPMGLSRVNRVIWLVWIDFLAAGDEASHLAEVYTSEAAARQHADAVSKTGATVQEGPEPLQVFEFKGRVEQRTARHEYEGGEA